jgi:chromosome segregation ATPase
MSSHEDEIKRYLKILSEDFQGQVRVVAEGHAIVVEKVDGLAVQIDRLDNRMDRLETKVEAIDARLEKVEARVEAIDTRLEKVEARVEAIDTRLERFQTETKVEFAELRSMIKFSYAELDARLMALERAFVDLRARVDRLEAGTPA